MMMDTRSSPWPDLQPELLGLVLKRLPSLADRVRLRAVCRTWRWNARLEPLPPPLPWVALLDGTYLSIPSGEIHRMPIPCDALSHGSVDNWLFLVHNSGRCSLMNPFSKAKLQLPNLTTIWRDKMRYRYAYSKSPLLYKLVVPSSVSLTQDSPFAAFTTDWFFHVAISICQPPITTNTVTNTYIEGIDDIVFFGGKLYALNRSENLFVMEIGEGHKGKPKISATRCIHRSIWVSRRCNRTYDEKCAYVNFPYLIESDGKLLLVRRHVAILVPWTDEHMARARTDWFDVFEADLSADSCHKWKIINTLRGQAIFVGRCSKSFPAADCAVQEDCIYFITDYHKSKPHVDPLFDSGVFNLRNGKITPLLPETVTVQTRGGTCHGRWFFPSEAM